MSEELNDIPGEHIDKNQQKLFDYLTSRMPDQEQHDFEAHMEEDDFMSDAVEGLQSVKDKNNLASLVLQLNADLKKQVNNKKARKEKRNIKEQPWIYFALVLLLLLIVAGYLVISRLYS